MISDRDRPSFYIIVATLICLTVICLNALAGPASTPTTNPALWNRMTEIDSRAGRIQQLSADFRQEKFTALLNHPLISSGKVRIRGPLMRWDTLDPDKSVLIIDQHEAKVYYPAQNILEIYPLDARLGELAASPLPRLEVLKARFSFEEMPARQLDSSAEPGKFLALRMVPTDPELSRHVQQVRVLLDVAMACIVKAEMTDADDDRTVLSFSNIRLNQEVGDLTLKVPPGTKITHPLEGLK